MRLSQMNGCGDQQCPVSHPELRPPRFSPRSRAAMNAKPLGGMRTPRDSAKASAARNRLRSALGSVLGSHREDARL